MSACRLGAEEFSQWIEDELCKDVISEGQFLLLARVEDQTHDTPFAKVMGLPDAFRSLAEILEANDQATLRTFVHHIREDTSLTHELLEQEGIQFKCFHCNQHPACMLNKSVMVTDRFVCISPCLAACSEECNRQITKSLREAREMANNRAKQAPESYHVEVQSNIR